MVAADAGLLQQRLLRAFLPRRRDGHRAGRGRRSPGRGQHRLHAHDRGAAPGRRDLSPDRRRLPRSPDLPAGFAAGHAGAVQRLSRRQRHARQRGRHRRRRRQGDLSLRARDDPLLSRRGADPAERADLYAAPTPDDLAYVLDHLEELVVKEARGSGGYGMLVGPRRSRGRARGLRGEAQGAARRTTSPSRPWRSRPAPPSSRRASRRAMSISGPSCSRARRSASCRAG